MNSYAQHAMPAAWKFCERNTRRSKCRDAIRDITMNSLSANKATPYLEQPEIVWNRGD
ncbi:Hypothetical protein HDN1F_18600 [gamma proteobacterium HdN1]|nr:Hypothetical protein HDN1F_18600 [gamma proteobacterium HdN1]